MSTWLALALTVAALAQQPGPASSRPTAPAVEAPAEEPEAPADTDAPQDVEPAEAPPVEAPDTDAPEAAPDVEPEEPAPEEPAPALPEPVEILIPAEDAPEPRPADAPAPEDLVSPVPLESPRPIEEAPAPAPVPAPAPAPAPVPAPAPAPEEVPFTGPVAPPARPPAAESEPPIIIVPPQGPFQPARDALRDALLPELPMRGLRNGLALLLLALASVLMANLARRARAPLLPDGVLPTTLRLVETVSRLLVVFFVLGVLAAWLPASIAPGLPWVVVAIAVAVGWSARDVLPDLVGWLFISLEGNVRPGQWLSVDGRRGRVERVGMRATRLRDHLGNVLLMPNRALVRGPITADVGWPTIEVRLRLDPAHGPARIRSALREAAELSPWVAPCEPEVYREGEAWVVRLDLLDGTFADRLEGTLAERVEEILAR